LRRSHFDALQPVCPLCRTGRGQIAPLEISREIRHEGEHLIEGILQCTSAACLAEYPIIDGIPVLFPDSRTFLADSVHHWSAHNDFSDEIENILGECAGPGSTLDVTRQHLSSYTQNHWGEFDPDDPIDQLHSASIANVLRQVRALEPVVKVTAAPALDAGCAVGRGTFELARSREGLVLGIDRHVPMLRLAARALRSGVVRYPRRRIGMTYDLREFPVPKEGVERVDFWACDATALPFHANVFGEAVALNLIDAVHAPIDLLQSFADVLSPGAPLGLATPYDWSGGVTPAEAWLGGHSKRAPGRGEAEPVLRSLLSPSGRPVSIAGLQLSSETESAPWTLRLHDRSDSTYRLHLLKAIAIEPNLDEV
jgi:SAM-dependent methyltransferase/uncharacterized protein YbaR (Trm112 family)